MKIVIDGRMVGWTGIGRYTSELIDHLQRLDHDSEYVIVVLPQDRERFPKLPANFSLHTADIKPYSLKEQLSLPSILNSLDADLVHFVHFSAPILYRRPRIITIHDLTLVHYKTNRGNGLARIKFELKYWGMRAVLWSAIKRSVALITVTRWVKEDIMSTYGSGLGDRIFPIHLSAEAKLAEPEPLDQFKLDSPFLLYVGNYYPHKNIDRLLEAFAILAQQGPDLKLVLVGQENYFLDQLRLQAKELKIGDRILTPGRISDGELAALYMQAKLFVFPSLSEGFGLPPLEAMAAGTPVISSNATCLPEVLGDAAAYFDPHDPIDMAAKISGLLDDATELERLRRAGLEQVKRFSWETMTKETLEVYKRNR